jgi:predicted ATP-grasp superfamily ATP-dependent carboligase
MKVLVLDAEQKSALASVRSLGRRGVEVLTGTHRRITRGALSRYSKRCLHLPAPTEEDAFVASLVEQADARNVDVVLPIGGTSNRVVSKHKTTIAAHCAVPVADWGAMRIAYSKADTLEFARTVGTPAPQTFADKDAVESFPVVVKRSLGAGGVAYISSAAELERVNVHGAVIQEYIPGQGYGFFAIFDRGAPHATFMHRRIREYPATGGASTAAESFYDEELQAAGLHLLAALHWHGVAMVEFKRDSRDGSYRLMEINPKFWGSLDLAIAAGVDYPWLAVQLALGQLDTSVPRYRHGVRYQWVFDDMVRVAARPRSLTAFVKDLRSSQNDISLQDPLPGVYDVARAAASIAVRAARGNLRYPHGSPESFNGGRPLT